MDTKQAGRKGGKKTAKRGKAYYQRIGQKGGTAALTSMTKKQRRQRALRAVATRERKRAKMRAGGLL
jgi:hypothetical protein